MPRARTSRPNLIVPSQNNDIPVRIKRMEYLDSLTFSKSSTAVLTKSFTPTLTTMPILSRFAKLYEMYVIHSMAVVFKTASRTTRDGQVIIAVDYNSKSTATPDKVKLLSMPNIVFPIHKDGSRLRVSVPATLRYVTQSDQARDVPFAIQAYATTNTVEEAFVCGDIYLDYDIELKGVRP